MDVDVIVVGGGPVGLMLATELSLAGLRPLVLERRPEIRETARANGLGGQILDLLRYRGLLDRVEAAGTHPARQGFAVPFGGVHVDLSNLAAPRCGASGSRSHGSSGSWGNARASLASRSAAATRSPG